MLGNVLFCLWAAFVSIGCLVCAASYWITGNTTAAYWALVTGLFGVMHIDRWHNDWRRRRGFR